MPKNKLKKFIESTEFENFFQPSYSEVKDGFYLRGKWANDFFKNNNPIILELGCGKAEYTIGLAEKYQNNNYIGMDIKGSRMWRGGKTSIEKKINNVAFVRSKIELIENFFGPKEISGIWISFPDPQPKNKNIKRRLTSPKFLNRYKNILKPNSIIHLKTDNIMLFEYTLNVINKYNHSLLFSTKDLYNSGINEDVVLIQTYYEKMFLKKGIPINYLKFKLNIE